MADIQELVKARRHIKEFTDRPVAEEDVIEWLNTAIYAPNHRMTQPWEVIVVGPETRSKLNHPADFGHAPLVMAIVWKAPENAIERDENLISTAAMMQNFCLLAWAHGVGVRWTSVGWRQDIKDILGVPEGHEVLVVGVGYPETIPSVKPRTPITEKLRRLP